MKKKLVKWYILLISQAVILGEVESSTSNDENRHARVNGRIVKLYSGTKSEPITCTEEGFRADPVDCSIFYRCIKAKSGKYSVFRFQCGPGTVYDPDTEVCNHPHSTKRSECRSNRPFQFLPAHVDQFNENDIDSYPHELPVPITTKQPLTIEQPLTVEQSTVIKSNTSNHQSLSPIEYETYLPIGETPKTMESYQQVETMKPTEISKTSVVSTPYPWTFTISSANYHTPTKIYSTNGPGDNECTHDGFMGDDRDCRKFYRCVSNQGGGYTKHEFMCSETTIWDDDIQNCNHPWAVRRRRCARDVLTSEYLSNDNVSYNKNKNSTEEDLTYYDEQKSKAPKQTTKSIITSSQSYYGDRININKETNNEYRTETYYDVTEKQQVQTQPTSHYIEPLNQTQKQLYDSITEVSTSTPYDHAYSVYNTSHSTNKAMNIECTESGFMGDPNDCRKFYRCVQNGKGSYTKHEFLCGEGTAWDKHAESCNHAWIVKECGGKIIHNTPTIGQSNIIMENSTTESNIISAGNAYNVERESSEKESGPLFVSRVTQSLPETTKVLLEPSGLQPSVEMCNSLGYMGSKTDCRKFFRCIKNGTTGGFTKLEYICDEGTLWDPKLEACNHASVVKDCKVNLKNESNLSTSSTESTIITTISFIQTTIQSSSENDLILEVINDKKSTSTSRDSRCQENGFLADQYDCRKFYRCVENGNSGFIRYEYVCGEGTAWDSTISACNHLRADKTCGSNYINEPTTLKQPPSESDTYIDNTYTSQINNNIIKSTDSTTEINTSSHLTTAKNKLNLCNTSGFIGDSVDCKKFYRCVSNSDGTYAKYEFSCGEGTVWDPEIEACNHVGAVKKCGGSLQTKQEIFTTESMTTVHSANEDLGDSGYFTQSLGNISSPGQNTLQSSSEYTPVANKNRDCNSVGFLADKNDCKKFYRCVENEQGDFSRFEFSCGDGTAWDQSIQACNHISSVKECTMVVTDIPSSIGTTTQSGSIGSSTQLGTQDHSIISNYPQHEEPTTFKTSHSNYVCTAEGFYGDTVDCKKFYRCVSNQQGEFLKYEFACGDGTIWDQNIKACNRMTSDNMDCTEMSTASSTSKPSVAAIEPSYTQETQDNKELNENSTTEKHEELPSHVDNTCSSEGFYPNVKDCKKFIRCVNNGDGNYVRYDFTCGEGTIWVQDIQACDHANDNSTCSNVMATITEVHMLTTTISTSLVTSSSTTTPSTIQSSITNDNDNDPTENAVSNMLENDECHSEGYYGNSNDCRRFYRCVVDERGKLAKYGYNCGEGTAWDLDTQSCNHISAVKKCANVQQTTTMVTNVGQLGTTDKTTKKPATNVAQTTDYIKTTISPTTVGQSQITENIKTTLTPTTNAVQLQTTVNIRTTKGPTTTANTASMAEDPAMGNHCNKEGYFGNTENCKMFYRCVNNGNDYIKYDYVCGEGTIWDQDILTCNHPQDVKNPSCDEDSENSTTSVSTDSPIQSTKSTSSTSQISPTSTTSMQTTTSTSENSIQGTSNCSGSETSKHENLTCTKAGYFPNPNDCKKFYRCVDWDGNGQRFSIFHFECGDGTIWDPALDTCNYEASVYPPRNCHGSQTQTISNTPASVENTTSSITTETTTQTTQTTQQITSTESTTQQQSTSETTTIQSTPTTVEQSTTQQTTPTTERSTSTQSSSESTTTTMTEQSTTQQTTTTTEGSTSTQSSSETTTTTMTEQPTTQQSTPSTDKSTSTQSTIDTTTISETTTTTTDQTTTSEATTPTEQTTSASSEKSTSTTELTTTSQQPTSATEQSTSEQSTSEQSTTDTTLSSTGQSTTTGETTTQMSTTTQQTSTELSTEEQNSTSTTTESTTNTSTTTETTQETTTEPSPTKKCPDTESDQYLYACPTSFKRHPKYCNLFYQCLEDNDSHELKIAVFNCPNGTIYDETKIQCVEESKAEYKCEGAVAKKRRFKRLNGNDKEIIAASKNKYGCSRAGHFPFEKKEECSPALLKCEISKSGKLRGFVYRCPNNYVYWSISRKCEPISKMVDCKSTTSQWTNRWEIPIERI